jgi:hypothetical protein
MTALQQSSRRVSAGQVSEPGARRETAVAAESSEWISARGRPLPEGIGQ